MKLSSLSTLTLSVSALALVLAAPNLAVAKGNMSVAKAPQAAKTSHTKTTSGLIDTTKQGQGTYTRSVTRTDGTKVVTVTDTFANGSTTSKTTDVTKNVDGSVSKDSTSTSANGKTSTKDETVTSTGTAGDYTITGTDTNAKGKVATFSGTKTATDYGTDTALTYTNAKGLTKTINDEGYKTNDASANVVTGTGYKGQAIDHASLRTTNTNPTGNDVDTSANGQGTYVFSQSVSGATSTYDTARTYGNGATQDYTQSVTTNPDGSLGYTFSGTSTEPGGTPASSSRDETLTPNGTGIYNIAGTFTQSNDHNGSLTGTATNTNYGNVTAMTYTDQNGLTKTTSTQSLSVGDATLNLNSLVGFNGVASNTVGLVTGQQVTNTK